MFLKSFVFKILNSSEEGSVPFRLSYILSEVIWSKVTFGLLNLVYYISFLSISCKLHFVSVKFCLRLHLVKGYISSHNISSKRRRKKHYLKQLFCTFIKTYIKYIMLKMMLSGYTYISWAMRFMNSFLCAQSSVE